MSQKEGTVLEGYFRSNFAKDDILAHSKDGKETKVLRGYFLPSLGAIVGLMGRSGFYKAGRGNNFQTRNYILEFWETGLCLQFILTFLLGFFGYMSVSAIKFYLLSLLSFIVSLNLGE